MSLPKLQIPNSPFKNASGFLNEKYLFPHQLGDALEDAPGQRQQTRKKHNRREVLAKARAQAVLRARLAEQTQTQEQARRPKQWKSPSTMRQRNAWPQDGTSRAPSPGQLKIQKTKKEESGLFKDLFTTQILKLIVWMLTWLLLLVVSQTISQAWAETVDLAVETNDQTKRAQLHWAFSFGLLIIFLGMAIYSSRLQSIEEEEEDTLSEVEKQLMLLETGHYDPKTIQRRIDRALIADKVQMGAGVSLDSVGKQASDLRAIECGQLPHHKQKRLSRKLKTTSTDKNNPQAAISRTNPLNIPSIPLYKPSQQSPIPGHPMDSQPMTVKGATNHKPTASTPSEMASLMLEDNTPSTTTTGDSKSKKNGNKSPRLSNPHHHHRHHHRHDKTRDSTLSIQNPFRIPPNDMSTMTYQQQKVRFPGMFGPKPSTNGKYNSTPAPVGSFSAEQSSEYTF